MKKSISKESINNYFLESYSIEKFVNEFIYFTNPNRSSIGNKNHVAKHKLRSVYMSRNVADFIRKYDPQLYYTLKSELGR